MKRTSEQSVWSEFISARQARKVARALKEAGYSSATIEGCRGYVINVARYFEPAHIPSREVLLRIITEAAGIQPRKVEP